MGLMRVLSLRLISGLPLDDCVQRICDATCPRRSFAFSLPPWPPEKPVAGYLRNNSFCLWKAFPCNSFRCLLYGQVRPYKVGTIIEGHFQTHPFVRMFVICWFGMAFSMVGLTFVIMVLMPLVADLRVNSEGIYAVAFSLLVTLACGLMVVYFRRLARNEPQFIEDFLIRMLEARQPEEEDGSGCP